MKLSLVSLFLLFVTMLMLTIPAYAGNTENDFLYGSDISDTIVVSEEYEEVSNTPPPMIQLYSNRISEESVRISTQLYNQFLTYDPDLFLLTDEGIKKLGYQSLGTDEDLAYVWEMAQNITRNCHTVNEKIYAVAEYMAYNICYDYDYYYHDSKTYLDLALSPWDVLKAEATVCEGYARTTAALLQLLDIPCICVDSPNHKWNMVYNGERWMLIDTTWISSSTYEYGIHKKSNYFGSKWYDFSINDANSEYNHTIENLALSVIDGVMLKFPAYTKKNHIVIPSNVHTIDCYVYDYGSVIESIYLPKSVTEITNFSFWGDTALKTIYYQGSREDFEKIKIGNNPDFLNCTDIRYLDEVSTPVIIGQPTDLYTGIGMTTTLGGTVLCKDATLSYQWYETDSRQNGTGIPIPGAVNSSITLNANTIGTKYYYLEVTATNPTVTGTKTKTVKTAPCKVQVFEEMPSNACRVGENVWAYQLTQSNKIILDGSGEVTANYIPFSGTSSSVLVIGKDISKFKYQKTFTEGVGKFAVESGNTAFVADEAGALYDVAERALLRFADSTVNSFTVLDGTIKIYENAISGYYLQSISLPQSLETIEGQLLFHHSSLQTISVHENNPNFYVDEYGALIDLVNRRIIVYPSGKSMIDQYVIPDGIVAIESRAFYDARIRLVKSNNDLISIGTYAFGNSDLKKFEFPATLNHIGDRAFSYCSSLQEVYFLGNVPTSFGESIFETWESYELPVIYYADTASGWSTPTWKDPNSSTEYSAYPFSKEIYCSGYACGRYASWSYHNGILTIQGTGALWDMEYDNMPWTAYKNEIHTVKISNGIKSIGAYAFFRHSSLTSVELPSSIVSIGTFAFNNCTALTEISIPASVTSIGNYAFYYCYNLEKVTLPNSLTNIGDCCFYYCNKLKSISIPDSVTKIGQFAFRYCSRLKSATFMGNVPNSFEKDVFASTASDFTIYYFEGTTGWTTPTWTTLDGTIYNTVMLERPEIEVLTINPTISYTFNNQSLTVTYKDACVVLYQDTNGQYQTIAAENNVYTVPTNVDKVEIYVKGDYDGDGTVKADDAVNLQKAILGKTEQNTTPDPVCDINGDGRVTALDLALMYAAAIGKYNIGW